MISLKNKIETVFGFGLLHSELIILSLQKNDEFKSILVEDSKLGNYVTKVVNGKLFYQKLNSQIIEYDGNEIFSYEDNFSYLSNAFVRNEHLTQ